MNLHHETSRSMTVLLVEDEPLVRMCACDALTDAGFTVFEAEHSAAAISALELDHAEIAVLFTDVHMPGEMNGVGLAHHTRARWPAIALLVTSAHPKPSLGELPAGSRFLGKPYSLDVVVNILKSCRRDVIGMAWLVSAIRRTRPVWT